MAIVELEKKKEYYRGKTIEELQALDIREFSKHLTSRERRSVLRNSDVVERFVKSSKEKQARGKPIKTHLRDLVIVPGLVGMTVQVYNGKEFAQVRVTTEMLGHRLGEFALTRRPVKHGAPGIGATKSSASASVK